MTPHKHVRRQRAEACGKLFHEYAARMGQSVRRTSRPTINLGRLTRNKESSDDYLHRYVDRADASRDDDESFPFPPNIRHRHSEDDGAPQPSWWGDFFR